MYSILKRRMKDQEISTYALALKSRIHPPDLYAALAGKREFYPGWRARVAEALGSSVEELFKEDKE